MRADLVSDINRQCVSPVERGAQHVWERSRRLTTASTATGSRWFGDFRGAVPGAAHTFCIDLGYWYPSPRYRFREVSGALRNRQGEAVSVVNQRKMAFAIWTFGRTSNQDQQAAVMLYVHSLMGDIRS